MPILLTIITFNFLDISATSNGGPITGPAIGPLTASTPGRAGRRRLPLDMWQLLHTLAVDTIKELPATKAAYLVTNDSGKTSAFLGGMILRNLVERVEDVFELDQIGETAFLGRGTVRRADAFTKIPEPLQDDKIRRGILYLLMGVACFDKLLPTTADSLNITKHVIQGQAKIFIWLENTTAHNMKQDRQLYESDTPKELT